MPEIVPLHTFYSKYLFCEKQVRQKIPESPDYSGKSFTAVSC